MQQSDGIVRAYGPSFHTWNSALITRRSCRVAPCHVPDRHGDSAQHSGISSRSSIISTSVITIDGSDYYCGGGQETRHGGGADVILPVRGSRCRYRTTAPTFIPTVHRVRWDVSGARQHSATPICPHSSRSASLCCSCPPDGNTQAGAPIHLGLIPAKGWNSASCHIPDATNRKSTCTP